MTPLARAGIGVVVVHGLGGSPHSVRPLAHATAAAGYVHTIVPLLAGHGTTPTDLIGCSWESWLADVLGAIDQLSTQCSRVVVVGQSMGATLALHAALLRPIVCGVAAINALVSPPDPDATEHLEYLIGRGRTMQPDSGADIRDPDAVDESYAEVALTALLELGRGATTIGTQLRALRVPVLVVSSDHDSVVDPANSDVLASAVAGRVTRLRLANSAHVAALDLDRERLCRELLTWLADLTDESAAPV